MDFDPNSTATEDSGLFGLPYSAEQSVLHLIPVPWEVTTSYGNGASNGPGAILRASRQVDLFDIETGDAYRNGYHMLPIPESIAAWNREFKAKAGRVLEAIEAGQSHDPEAVKQQAEINSASAKVNEWVYEQSRRILSANKFAAVIGGDHSTPFGLIRALTEKYQGDFGILHIDAHADLRDAYQGYENSHASIMFNVMEQLKPRTLVQVGIRDFSPGEYAYIQKHPQIHTFFDAQMKRLLHQGSSWQNVCDKIVSNLPQQVYISFDIDGLTPDLCPNTGTPVPGGLSFDQTLTLLATLAESGRRLIGFDLNEVAEPEGGQGDWDGNVGARVLFKLCGWLMVTNGLGKANQQEGIDGR